MRVAIIGSRNYEITDFENYLPPAVSEIISGGAKGIDSCAKKYAYKNNIPLKEFLPNYKIYGRGAPLKRNIQIIESADLVLAFWDGKSRGTKFVIDNCNKRNIPIKVIMIK